MLTYSEPSAGESEREQADKVDATVGADAYERKITQLLRNGYKDDVAAGRKAEWQRHLNSLRDEDLYILIMVQNAKIPSSFGYVGSPIGVSKLFSLDMVCLAGVGIAGVLLLFTPIGSFIKSGLLRAGLFVLWLAGLWSLGEWSKRRAFRPPG